MEEPPLERELKGAVVAGALITGLAALGALVALALGLAGAQRFSSAELLGIAALGLLSAGFSRLLVRLYGRIEREGAICPPD
jgi:hypothetical protein